MSKWRGEIKSRLLAKHRMRSATHRVTGTGNSVGRAAAKRLQNGCKVHVFLLLPAIPSAYGHENMASGILQLSEPVRYRVPPAWPISGNSHQVESRNLIQIEVESHGRTGKTACLGCRRG